MLTGFTANFLSIENPVLNLQTFFRRIFHSYKEIGFLLSKRKKILL